MVRVRPYVSSDAVPTLRIFREAVTVTASADYSAEQIEAWVGHRAGTAPEWDRGMLARDSVVALVDHEVAGFADVSAQGHIEMLFVAPRCARRGVARALLEFLEARARSHTARRLTADVSITARPFFEACGFDVVAEQHPVIDGIALTNFRMMKALDA